MKKRSILEELNNVHLDRDNDHLIDSTANNIIQSAINLIDRMEDLYGEESADLLERRLISSIRNSDPERFRRQLKRIQRDN